MSETVFAQPQNVLDTTVARIADALEDMAPSNVCIDISTSLPANGWSQSSPYVQIWTNNKVTDECAVKVEFPVEATNTGITYLEYEKVAGGVKFTAPSLPSTAIPVIVHIINAEAESITSISADMVSTSAVSGSSNVDEALGALNSKFAQLIKVQTVTIGSVTFPANGLYNISSFVPSTPTGYALLFADLNDISTSSGALTVLSGGRWLASAPNNEFTGVKVNYFFIKSEAKG